MDDAIGLFLMIGIAAVIFWTGFRMGYRYRDNQSLDRRKNYPARKIPTRPLGEVPFQQTGAEDLSKPPMA